MDDPDYGYYALVNFICVLFFIHHKFEMLYLYDAVSGKVSEMRYNAGKKDQFFHKFAYDAKGNLKYVWTSRDGKRWTLESPLKTTIYMGN